MRFIPTKVHGVLDYLTAVLLVAAPWLFGFARGGAETWVPVALGLGVVAYSAATAYEWGLFPALSMPVHLALDAGGGVLLALSPWLFGFADVVWLPHVLGGLFEVAAAALSRTAPERVLAWRGGRSPAATDGTARL